MNAKAENKTNWVEEIREKKGREIEQMLGERSPYAAATDKTFDFALFELQRRVQVKNVKAVRELRDTTKTLIKDLAKYRDAIKQESRRMLLLTIVLGIVATLQIFIVYGQFRLNEAQVDASQDQVSLQNAIWKYEMNRNDRIEIRDVNWRREDLEFQGRLP